MSQRRRRTDPEESEAHVHRRATDADSVLRLHDRLDDHARRLDGHDHLISGFTTAIDALNQNMGRVADVLETMTNLRGFWAVMKFISAAAKTMWPIAALVGAVWLYIKTGKWASGG